MFFARKLYSRDCPLDSKDSRAHRGRNSRLAHRARYRSLKFEFRSDEISATGGRQIFTL